MFHQLTDQTVNGSCREAASACNTSADGDALQLPTFSTAAKVRVIITFGLCAVSAVCNLVVLYAAGNGGKRKSHVRILIMNLTVADLLVTFIVMPVDAAWNITVQWLAGDVACRLLMFMKLVAMYSCAFVTVVISLDRQSAILNPLGISEAKRKSKVMLTVAWTMSVILSIPQVGENTFSLLCPIYFPLYPHSSSCHMLVAHIHQHKTLLKQNTVCLTLINTSLYSLREVNIHWIICKVCRKHFKYIELIKAKNIKNN